MTPLSWDPTPGAHIYVDESTAGDYLLMGAAIASADAPQMRSVMRGLLLPGSRSLHMRKERKRAATILSTVVGLGPKVAIFRVSRTTPALDARRATVHALAELACQLRADRVVFDTIDSMSARDRAWVIEGVHLAGEPTPRSAITTSAVTRNPCSGYPMRSAGRGPEGVSIVARSSESATWSTCRQREARHRDRPDGYRAHYLGGNSPS